MPCCRQEVWDPPIHKILEEMGAYELANRAGLLLWHNCNHCWTSDGRDWDQAVVCCTRYEQWTEAGAAALRDTASKPLFVPQPDKIYTLDELRHQQHLSTRARTDSRQLDHRIILREAGREVDLTRHTPWPSVAFDITSAAEHMLMAVKWTISCFCVNLPMSSTHAEDHYGPL